MKTIKHIVLISALSALFVGCAGDRYHRSTGMYIDDKSTAAKVKADLYSDPVVKGTQVRVDVYGGKVQLSGFVDTLQQKDRAAEIARRVNGVQWVKNDVIVKNQVPQGYPTTAYSTSRSVNEPAGANNPGNENIQSSTGRGIGVGAHVGPIGAGANVGGGSGVGAGAHVGPVGVGGNVGGSNPPNNQ